MAKAKKSKKSTKKSKIEEKLDKKLAETYGERFGNEIITRMNIAEANMEFSRTSGANKNLYRSIASLVDGCKPGKRRLLYAWRTDLDPKISSTSKEALAKRRFYRVDKLSSTATASYHPHSGSALESMIGKEGQYWSNNVLLVDPQGSYGKIVATLHSNM